MRKQRWLYYDYTFRKKTVTRMALIGIPISQINVETSLPIRVV